MAKFLVIHPEKCTGCKNCTLACSYAREGHFRPGAARMIVHTWEREGISVPVMCQQCRDAPCVSVCPSGAMFRQPGAALVEYDSQRCIRCRKCSVACPFGAAVYDSITNTILICDTCSGDPACVKFCPTGALTFEDETSSTHTRRKPCAVRPKDIFQEAD